MHCISNPVQSIKPPLPRCDLDLSHHVAFYCLIFVVGIISGNNVNCVCVVELKRRRSHMAHNTVRETIFQGLTSVPNQCLPLDFFCTCRKMFLFFGGKAVIGFVFKPLCFSLSISVTLYLLSNACVSFLLCFGALLWFSFLIG